MVEPNDNKLAVKTSRRQTKKQERKAREQVAKDAEVALVGKGDVSKIRGEYSGANSTKPEGHEQYCTCIYCLCRFCRDPKIGQLCDKPQCPICNQISAILGRHEVTHTRRLKDLDKAQAERAEELMAQYAQDSETLKAEHDANVEDMLGALDEFQRGALEERVSALKHDRAAQRCSEQVSHHRAQIQEYRDTLARLHERVKGKKEENAAIQETVKGINRERKLNKKGKRLLLL